MLRNCCNWHDFTLLNTMTEIIQINGKDIWIVIEPHAVHQPADSPQEYFTISYHFKDPANNPGAILMVKEDKSPCVFLSPVEALGYASEQLRGSL